MRGEGIFVRKLDKPDKIFLEFLSADKLTWDELLSVSCEKTL